MNRNEQRLAVALAASLLACAAMAATLTESQHKTPAAEAPSAPAVQVPLAFDPSLPSALEAFSGRQMAVVEDAPTF